jgi:hypothetical protein
MPEIFEHDFCNFLEYRICKFFNESNSEHTKGFWCDGVIFETMIDKTAIFTAFAGKNGQVKYKLNLHFGETSLSLIAKKSDIQSCIPASFCADAFTVDTNRKQINLYVP